MPFMLLQIQAEVQGSLNNLDADVANAAQNLSTAGLEGDAAREVLNKLLDTNSNLVEALTFGKDGKIISVVECKGCKGIEDNNTSGRDILSLHSNGNLSQSAIEVINQVLKTKAPAFSKVFKTMEGLNGTGLAYPVNHQPSREGRILQQNLQDSHRPSLEGRIPLQDQGASQALSLRQGLHQASNLRQGLHQASSLQPVRAAATAVEIPGLTGPQWTGRARAETAASN